MSNSPKYSVVSLSTELTRAERDARRRRAAARRQQEAERAAELRRLAADRAQRAMDGERAAISARLAEVSAMVTELTDSALQGDVRVLTTDLGVLRDRLSTATDLAACLRAAESLRARAVSLHGRARDFAGLAGRPEVLTDLRQRLGAAGADAASLEPRRYARCMDLLSQLEAAAGEEGVRFEALHGTAEHEVASYLEQATEAVRTARAKLGEAADRLATIRAAAESAAADAAAFREDDLAQTLRSTLAAADAALSAGQADPAGADAALGEVMKLDQLLPAAEARLDELATAHERRAEFAAALKGVLAEQGMAFLGASDTGNRFILQFERPGGALYTAAVDDGDDNELRLSYSIDGEADIQVLPEPGEAVCDQTEAFLEAVHADLAYSGYHAGEVQWDGKPPRGARSPRPRHAQQGEARLRRNREST